MGEKLQQSVIDLPADAIRQRITDIACRIERPGIDQVFTMLGETDFFDAPASTQYHSCFAGGLAMHSYIVYRLLANKNSQLRLDLSFATVAITGLLHDIAKCGTYALRTKNIKDGTRINAKGQVVTNWIEKPVWVVEDDLPLGHGEKSAFLLLKMIDLSSEELAMIRWHMGPYDNEKGFNQAAAKWPSVVALYASDMEAAHIVEARRPHC
jgi:hypothetical protein